MAQATFDFGGRSVLIDGPDALVGLASDLLRHHGRGTASPLAVLTCRLGTGELADDNQTWTWAAPEGITGRGPDWFFYYGFARVLHGVWDALGLVPLHGALLWSETHGGVLVVGDRHDGKSSVAAGWLDDGGMLATDDTVLLDIAGAPPLASGVRRELHLDPALAPALPRFTGLSTAEPYLPGRARVRYDWVARFPDQLVTAPVTIDAVIRTRVDAGRPTEARYAADALDDLLRTAVEDKRRHDVVRSWLASLPAWRVTWGPDVWSMPGKHRGFLRDLIGLGCERHAGA